MANYKKAPKLYHIGKKDGDKKNFIKIPQDLMESIFNQLNGRQGNVIKVILFLIGTVGDGSFGVSERWICDSTGMLKSCYIEARKTLVELGWVEVIAGRININFDKIRNMNGSCEATSNKTKVVLNEERVVLNDDMGCVNPKNGLCDTNCNREEQIINKEITIEEEPAQETNTDIKISRTGELEYILKRHNITEEDVKTIIRNNNIDDVTDFICFFHYMTKRDDCIASDSVPEIKNILSAYFECNKMKDIRSGYELYKEDIIEYASDEQKTIFTTSSFFHQFSSSTTLDDRKIESLQKLLSRGARLGTSFFKRNLGRPVAG